MLRSIHFTKENWEYLESKKTDDKTINKIVNEIIRDRRESEAKDGRQIDKKALDKNRKIFIEEFSIMQTKRTDGTFEHTYFERDIKTKELVQLSTSHIEEINCTGLKDKNGTLIYESDILSVRKEAGYDDCYFYINHIVYWDVKTLSWGIKPIITENWQISYSEDFGLCEHFTDDFEVIGNIHTNPELLERGD